MNKMEALIKRYGQAAVELAQEFASSDDEVKELARSHYLYIEHSKYIENNFHGFKYNFGWAQGNHYVTSKIYGTNATYVESRLGPKDEVIHDIL